MLHALGFSVGEIIGQFRMKMLIAVGGGTVLGTVVAATLGERLVGALLALMGLGLTRLSFIPQPWIVDVVFPLLLIGAGMAGSARVTGTLRTVDHSEWVR